MVDISSILWYNMSSETIGASSNGKIGVFIGE